MTVDFPNRIIAWAQVADLIAADALTPAELEVIRAAKAGEEAQLGDTVPTEPSDAVRVRAPLLRYLILGGCEKCKIAESGIRVNGAWIEGLLDLDFTTSRAQIGLYNCHIAEQPQLLESKLGFLNLAGSKLAKGLYAQGSHITGNVLLRYVESDGEISVFGVVLDGQLDCEAAKLRNGAHKALNAEGMRVTGHVLLRNVEAEGQVCLVSAFIGGQLAFDNATLGGASRTTLHAQRVTVRDGFYWRDVDDVTGAVDLNAAHFADLVCDKGSWDQCDSLLMANMTYDTISDDMTTAQRLEWLEKGSLFNGEFHPQPYEQLATVLRKDGHRSAARDVLYAKEVALLAAAKAEVHSQKQNASFWQKLALTMRALRSDVVGGLLRFTVGFGYKPWRSLRILIGLIIFATSLSHLAWQSGDFAPNSDVVLVSTAWQTLAEGQEAVANPAQVWSAVHAPGQDYATFQPLLYGIDVVVPIIAIGQEAAWAPSTNRSVWGRILWAANPILTILGWLVTAIGAAAVTGVIRND
ncbi:MAG: hypothetical protein AAGF56_00135 [Pseudomonadota bacterium]